MRKIILNVAISLDGFIEGTGGEYDWCFTDQDYGMTSFLNGIDTIFFGRKTYDALLKMERKPYPDKLKYVFSTTMESVGDDCLKIIRSDVMQEVKKIKSQHGKDIWLFGGANLTNQFLKAGLLDEMQLAVHPIILGGGTSLFYASKKRHDFDLTDVKSYSSGLVQLFYKLKD